MITSLQRARELGAADGLLVLATDTAGVDPELLGIGAAVAAERLLAGAGIRPPAWGSWNSMKRSQPRPSPAWITWASTRSGRMLDGGALALGHAYGASGAVLVARLLAQARASAKRASWRWP